ARETGEYLLRRMRELEDIELVGEVRGIGMMFGIELVTDRAARTPLPTPPVPLPDVLRRETGVIVRNCGHSLVLSPPLILSRDEADRIVEALRSVLERLRPDGSVAA
ncbi:MAG: aminotransferase class III-fold pyridoxal phosphate-dependent enzyme, partial [Solirubrobacteraceae bacterium]